MPTNPTPRYPEEVRKMSEKNFNHFKVSFDVDDSNELFKQIERAEQLIKELKDVLYRISGMRGTIKAEEMPPTNADGE